MSRLFKKTISASLPIVWESDSGSVILCLTFDERREGRSLRIGMAESTGPEWDFSSELERVDL